MKILPWIIDLLKALELSLKYSNKYFIWDKVFLSSKINLSTMKFKQWKIIGLISSLVKLLKLLLIISTSLFFWGFNDS